MSDGVDNELTLEKEQLRLSKSGENKRGEADDGEEPIDGVVFRQVLGTRLGERRGSGVVFRLRGSLSLSCKKGGTNVTGSETGLEL